MADFNGAMAGADEVLGGIKRQQVTGLPPSNMLGFRITSGDTKAYIRIMAPNDTTIDGQVLCTVAGVMVRRKTGSAPTSIYDGTLVLSLDRDTMNQYRVNSYEDSGLINGTTYYYRAFPYSDHYIYNLSPANIKSVVPGVTKIWGFTQTFTDLAPETTIAYTNENADYTAMHHNKDQGTVTDGSWLGTAFPWLAENLPYMVKNSDATADYALDPDDYTLRSDGVTASDVSNKDYDGVAMAWIPKIYSKETYTTSGRTVQFALSNKDESTQDFLPVGFLNQDNEELDGIWIPMFYMSSDGNAYAGSTPVSGLTSDQEYVAMQAKSESSVFLGGPILNVLRDIEYMLCKSTDVQKHFGQGRMSAYSSSSSTGVIANAVVGGGRFYGTNANAFNKMFHSNVLGSYQQVIRDPYTLTISGVMYSSKNYKYDLSGAKLTKTGITIATSSAMTYPSKTVYMGDGLGSFPDRSSTNGTTATGLCDGIYTNASGTCAALRLGFTADGLADGPAYVRLNNAPSYGDWPCGVGRALLPAAGYAPRYHV